MAQPGDEIPIEPVLSYQNEPNPFLHQTTIEYRLATGGLVTLRVFDPTGREIETLVDGPIGAGLHRIEWRPDADTVPSGIYLYHLSTPYRMQTRKLTLLGR